MDRWNLKPHPPLGFIAVVEQLSLHRFIVKKSELLVGGFAIGGDAGVLIEGVVLFELAVVEQLIDKAAAGAAEPAAIIGIDDLGAGITTMIADNFGIGGWVAHFGRLSWRERCRA